MKPTWDDFTQAYDEAMRMATMEGNFRGGWNACVRWFSQRAQPAQETEAEHYLSVLRVRDHNLITELEKEVTRLRKEIPAQETAQTDAETVKEMLDAWYGDTEGLRSYDFLQRTSMTVALMVARRGLVPATEPMYTAAQISRAVKASLHKYKFVHELTILGIGKFTDDVLSRLTAPQQEKTAEERVTIQFIPGSIDGHMVMLDGVRVFGVFATSEQDAKRYRLGLIAELKGKI